MISKRSQPLSKYLTRIKSTVQEIPSWNWMILIFLILLMFPEQGFCGDATPYLDEIETSAKNIKDLIFSKQIRFVILVISCGFGAIKAMISQSFQHALVPIGLGCLFFFIPKLIDALNAIFT